MLAKAKAKKGNLISEGTYATSVTSIKGKPNDDEPKKVNFGFTPEGQPFEIYKELPFSFEDGTLLRKDAETLLGRQLTSKEAEDGFDLKTLIGRKCRVVVVHKATNGGKLVAVVSLVLPIES